MEIKIFGFFLIHKLNIYANRISNNILSGLRAGPLSQPLSLVALAMQVNSLGNEILIFLAIKMAINENPYQT
jgi:hypothetical protein